MFHGLVDKTNYKLKSHKNTRDIVIQNWLWIDWCQPTLSSPRLAQFQNYLLLFAPLKPISFSSVRVLKYVYRLVNREVLTGALWLIWLTLELCYKGYLCGYLPSREKKRVTRFRQFDRLYLRNFITYSFQSLPKKKREKEIHIHPTKWWCSDLWSSDKNLMILRRLNIVRLDRLIEM